NTYSNGVVGVAFNPANPTNCIAWGYSDVLSSNDGGSNWLLALHISDLNNSKAAYAPSDPTIVYASMDHSTGQTFGDLYMYKSVDSGRTYLPLGTQTGLFEDSPPGGQAGDQGWHDHCIWVDPTNPNILVVG